MGPPRPTLVLFARAPVAGIVKTRLAGRLAPEGAARLYEAFLEDAARVYVSPGWNSVLYADPDPDDPALALLFGPPWRREAQARGDLGVRLAVAFRAENARGAPVVAAVGSDHPALPRRRLDELFRAVGEGRGRDAAVVPALDGGYCAIALSTRIAPDAAFRDIPWSSPGTLHATLDRLRAEGVSVALLDPASDVDRPEDLDRLAEELAARDPSEDDFPRATATALAALLALAARQA